MVNRFKLALVLFAVAGAFTAVTADSAAAELRSPIVGKGSVVSRRAFLSYTWGRANAHKNRIAFIRARHGK